MPLYALDMPFPSERGIKCLLSQGAFSLCSIRKQLVAHPSEQSPAQPDMEHMFCCLFSYTSLCFHITSIYFCAAYRTASWSQHELQIPDRISLLRRLCLDYWGRCVPDALHGCGSNHRLCGHAAARDQKVLAWQSIHSWSKSLCRGAAPPDQEVSSWQGSWIRRQRWCQGLRQVWVLDAWRIPRLSPTVIQWSNARLPHLWWHPCRQCWTDVDHGLKSYSSSRQYKGWQCFPIWVWYRPCKKNRKAVPRWKRKSSWSICFEMRSALSVIWSKKTGMKLLSVCKQLLRYRVSNLTKVWCCLRIWQYFISMKPDCHLWIWIKAVPKTNPYVRTRLIIYKSQFTVLILSCTP